jgi:hypothetical protein
MTQPILDTSSADARTPRSDEYAPYYDRYISRVAGLDLLGLLREQRELLARVPATVPGKREGHRYAPDKWSVREVIGHLSDAERVFGYRAFCFSRGEEAALPGFDENVYVERAGADARTLADLVAELVALRDANLALFGALSTEQWRRSGVANGLAISVRALAHVTAGHVDHHLAILRERYGLEI